MALTKPKLAKQCAETMSGFAEPTRIQIINVLRTGPMNVGEIAKAIKAKMVNTSHHVGILRKAGLVEDKKDGRFVVYSLAPAFTSDKSGLRIDLSWCRVTVTG